MSWGVKDDEEYYINPKGLLVFTEQYHLKRGYCCGNACLHCPYNYKSVDEPRRTALRALRNKEKGNNPTKEQE